MIARPVSDLNSHSTHAAKARNNPSGTNQRSVNNVAIANNILVGRGKSASSSSNSGLNCGSTYPARMTTVNSESTITTPGYDSADTTLERVSSSRSR